MRKSQVLLETWTEMFSLNYLTPTDLVIEGLWTEYRWSAP